MPDIYFILFPSLLKISTINRSKGFVLHRLLIIERRLLPLSRLLLSPSFPSLSPSSSLVPSDSLSPLFFPFYSSSSCYEPTASDCL